MSTQVKNLDYNKPNFTVKQVDFGAIKDYKIVYPQGDKLALVLAKYLREFFKKYDNAILPIVSDEAAADSKEILIGDTNRYKTSLSETEFAVTVKDEKLIFEGGHSVMVEKAVKWFMASDRVNEHIATIKGIAEDFKSKVLINGEEYEHVWGDEFDGNIFDTTKFVQQLHMDTRPIIHRYKGINDTMKIEDGLLKMFTTSYINEETGELEFAVPECLCTDDTMWWLYGYAEIRAKVPMQHGAWPAWWATSYCNCKRGKTDDWKYLVEIDFFEVFCNEVNVVPNIHKWYKNYAGPFTELYDEEGKEIRHRGWTDMHLPTNFYKMPKEEKDGFHTFGFLWTPQIMTMSVDGEDYMTFDLSKNFDNMTDMSEFVDEPLHMIFDNWIDMALTGARQKEMYHPEDFPIEFFVEYARIYQKKGEGYLINSGVDKDI